MFSFVSITALVCASVICVPNPGRVRSRNDIAPVNKCDDLKSRAGIHKDIAELSHSPIITDRPIPAGRACRDSSRLCRRNRHSDRVDRVGRSGLGREASCRLPRSRLGARKAIVIENVRFWPEACVMSAFLD